MASRMDTEVLNAKGLSKHVEMEDDEDENMEKSGIAQVDK